MARDSAGVGSTSESMRTQEGAYSPKKRATRFTAMQSDNQGLEEWVMEGFDAGYAEAQKHIIPIMSAEVRKWKFLAVIGASVGMAATLMYIFNG